MVTDTAYSPRTHAARTQGPVHIIGAGLLGASVGLGLRERGVDVTLEDLSPTTVALAVDYGAGAGPLRGPAPRLLSWQPRQTSPRTRSNARSAPSRTPS